MDVKERQRHLSQVPTDSLSLQHELASLAQKIALLKQEIETGCRASADSEAVNDPMFFTHSQVSRLAAAGATDELKEILSAKELDINTIRVSDERTPLHLAAMGGHAATIEILLTYGIDVNAVDYDGNTARDLAISAGFLQIAERLQSAMPNAPTIFFAHTPTVSGVTSPSSNSNGLPFDFKGFVVLLVGLPGRGKSFVAAHICRYFSWHGVQSRVLSHQDFRVSELGSDETRVTPLEENQVASAIATETRNLLLEGTGLVVLDGSHATRRRREALRTGILTTTQLNPERFIMVEVINSNEKSILRNARRLGSNITVEHLEEYSKLVKEQEKTYETLDVKLDRHVSFIRLIEERRVELNNIQGVIPTFLAHLLHNLRQDAPSLYLTESGEWEDLVLKKLGGDSNLTAAGNCYSVALFEFISKELGRNRFLVMSSTAARAVQTCQQFAHIASLDPCNNVSQDDITSGFGTSPVVNSMSLEVLNTRCRVAYFPTLVDINHGDCEGQTEEAVQAIFPGTMANMRKDPFNVAWPNGESINQVFTARLEQHIHDIQASQVPTVVVAHKAVIQGLLVYFGLQVGPESAPSVNVPLHTLFKLSLGPDNHQRKIEMFDLNPRVCELMKEIKMVEENLSNADPSSQNTSEAMGGKSSFEM